MTTDHPVISPKKLIEVALPLDAINSACAYEKMPGIGPHPRGIHHWWARRPLAAARAVIFGQLVNDPEDLWWHQNPGAVPNNQIRGHWTKSRQRLFKIIEELVLWENIANHDVLERAKAEIQKSWEDVCKLNQDHPQAVNLFNPEAIPGLHDPFAGGGAIPLEAQRLGLDSFATDLNPVAVLINKAMIEIPPKFAGQPPVHPDVRKDKKLFAKEWKGAEGLAEDVRRYGQWMRDEAERRIGHLYPKVEITAEMAKKRADLKPLLGRKLTVIAWLWARTAKSPSPAYSDIDVPLVNSFVLSNNPRNEAYVQPIITAKGYSLNVVRAVAPPEASSGTKASRGNFRCVMSGAPISAEYLRIAGRAGQIGSRLMAIVADGPSGRVYLSPIQAHEDLARTATPSWRPDVEFFPDALGFRIGNYGMSRWSDLFTPRQLVVLDTLAGMLRQLREAVHADAMQAGRVADAESLENGGLGVRAYADAISIYLAFAIDRTADFSNAVTRWVPGNQKIMNLFSKQVISMTWDYPEANVLAGVVGGFGTVVDYISKCLPLVPASGVGVCRQSDAQTQEDSVRKFCSTDPPYYDNMGYADLSDFFYVWLRRSLKEVLPSVFSTIAVPKAEELVATPKRHGSPEDAEAFFLNGMTRAMRQLADRPHPAAPITIYYAFKQADTEDGDTNSTGWETFLGAVLAAGLTITGTWPIRSEQAVRQRGMGSNALASSIVLVCRPRDRDAQTITRRQFVRLLNDALPLALDAMTRASEGEHSPVAPVDLSQAIIGPGMAMFSRYDAVLEADGTPMTVKTALQLINRFLAEDDFDADTQFCLHWFDQHGWETAKFGEADTLARAKGTSVDGVKQAGVIEAGGGNVRLLKWKEYPADWDAKLDTRLPVWEALHQLIRAYSKKGDSGAGKVLKAVANQAEAARQLAYRLYTLCERKGWAEDARAYNEIVTGWSGIEAAIVGGGESQTTMFD